MTSSLFLMNQNILFRLLALVVQSLNLTSTFFIETDRKTVYKMNEILTYIIFLVYCLIIAFMLYDAVINKPEQAITNTLMIHLLEHYYLFAIASITGYMSYMYYYYDYKYKELYKNAEFIYNYRIQMVLLLLQVFLSFYLYMGYGFMGNKESEKILLHSVNVILSIVNTSYVMKLYLYFDKVVTTSDTPTTPSN